MTTFIVIMCIMFLVAVFFIFGANAFIAFLRKKYLKGVISIITVGAILLLLLTLTRNTLGITSLIGGLISAISMFFTNDMQKDKGTTVWISIMCFISMMIMIFAMGFSLLELKCERHIVYEPYTIRVCDNSVEVTANFDKLPDRAYSEIVSKSVKMKENGEEYYEGRVITIYECIDKIFSELHSECTCTSEELCDLCKENILNTRVIVE